MKDLSARTDTSEQAESFICLPNNIVLIRSLSFGKQVLKSCAKFAKRIKDYKHSPASDILIFKTVILRVCIVKRTIAFHSMDEGHI